MQNNILTFEKFTNNLCTTVKIFLRNGTKPSQRDYCWVKVAISFRSVNNNN